MTSQNTRSASVCGKIILTGEYAVVFGHPGIAIPTALRMTVTFEEDPAIRGIVIKWDTTPRWKKYIDDIVDLCVGMRPIPHGILSIENNIPLGKGMGSSTALVIAITAALLDTQYKNPAQEIENTLNPGHSGIDFDVIWNQAPVRFVKGESGTIIDLPNDLLKGALLIDTGTPNESTPELVSRVTERKDEPEIASALVAIGQCTARLEAGEKLTTILHDHHRAQVALGVVTEEAQSLISSIEDAGGSAKVLGAGGRTGGSGMVLALNVDANTIPDRYPVITL